MEKKIINIYNTEQDSNDYLKLTNSEIAFLKWLNDMGYLDDYTYFDEVSKLSNPIEF